jgi:hypothetical protein
MIKCRINDELVDCKVIDNLHYQNGYYVKEVLYKNEKKIVVKKSRNIWREYTSEERIGIPSQWTGQ